MNDDEFAREERWKKESADRARKVCLDEGSGRARGPAGAGRGIMYLGARELKRPKGPARLKGILEKRETILSKWRDGRTCSRATLFFQFCVLSHIHTYIHTRTDTYSYTYTLCHCMQEGKTPLTANEARFIGKRR